MIRHSTRHEWAEPMDCVGIIILSYEHDITQSTTSTKLNWSDLHIATHLTPPFQCTFSRIFFHSKSRFNVPGTVLLQFRFHHTLPRH